MISGRRYWLDGTPVSGQQFNYAFDDIGNRDTTGGRASAESDYSANYLNQYTSRTVAGAVDVVGIANPTAAVTVNGNTAYRQGEYFHFALPVNNSSAAYPTITAVSQYGGTQSDSGEVFVPASTESFTHDLDGNLTQDGRWAYTWDGENRLIEMKRDTSRQASAASIDIASSRCGSRSVKSVPCSVGSPSRQSMGRSEASPAALSPSCGAAWTFGRIGSSSIFGSARGATT